MDVPPSPSPRPSPVRIVDEERGHAPCLVPAPVIDIDTIRAGIRELAESDRLDKDSALTMTRLFHTMETLMRHECTRRETQISRVEGELERARIQHELDRIANAQYHHQPGVAEVTPMRRSKSKW